MSTNCAVLAAVSSSDVRMTGAVGSYNTGKGMLTSFACMMKALLPRQVT